MKSAATRLVALIIGLVWCLVFLASPIPTYGQGVTKATLDGTFVLDRSKPSNPCVVISPPVLRGTLKLIVDIDKGQISGDFRGGGSGQVGLRAQCGQDELDREFKADTTFAGTIAGTVNRTSGAIDARVTVNTLAGKLYQVELAGHRCLYQGNWLTECPKREPVVPQAATLKGTVRSDGTASGELIWDTSYCLKLSKNVDGNCAADEKITRGTWTAKGPALQLGSVNHPPEIIALSQLPENPDSDDTVTFTVTSRDPDGDKPKYAWTVDGGTKGDDSRSFVWAKPPAGTYDVKVTVSDGKGAQVSKLINLVVKEAESAGDKDVDGVPNRDDACPEEWGDFDKGCPAFAVTLSCPEQVTESATATCTAAARGRRTGESIRYDWSAGGMVRQSGENPTFSWTMEPGPTTVTVEAIGDGRWERTSKDIEGVSQAALAVSIGMAPNPALIDKPIVFSASVLGNRPNEKILYQWSLDGQTKCGDTATCPVGALTAGEFTMRVLARGQGEGREAQGTFDFSVSAPPPLAPNAMGFRITGINCTDGVSSDEKLSCRAFFEHEGNKPVPLEVAWLVDGATMASGTATGSSVWSLDQPAPGTHTVQVRALDPISRAAAASTTTITIRPGANAQIPPADQAAAAAGTAALAATWLWGEWWAGRRGARARAPRRDAQHGNTQAGSTQDEKGTEPERSSYAEPSPEGETKHAQDASKGTPDIADLQRKRASLEIASREHRTAMEKSAMDFEKARAEWNLENQSQMSDAVIDVVDLTQSVAQDLTGVSAVGSKLAAKVAGEAGVKAVAARVVAAGVKGFGEESVKSTAKELYRQHWRREAAEMPETLPTIGSRVAKQAVGFPASGGAKGVEVQALEEAAAALEREAASRVLGPADPAQVGDRLIKRQVGTPNPVSRAADAGSTIAQAAAKTLSYGETIASGVRDYVGREALKSKISDRKWAAWDRYWQERAKWRQARMDHQQLVRKITSTVRER